MEYKPYKLSLFAWIVISLSTIFCIGLALALSFCGEPIAIILWICFIGLLYSAYDAYSHRLIRYRITENSFTVYDKRLEGGVFELSKDDFDFAYERTMGKQGVALILSKKRLDGKAVRRVIRKTFFSRKIHFEDVFVIYLEGAPKEACDMFEKFASPIDSATQWYYD